VAYDINNTGLVVGSADGSDGESGACLWDADGASDLGGLSGGRWNEAREINDSGELILWGVPAGGSEKHAAYWSGEAGSPVVDLGTFGGRESWAIDLNNDGLIVGWADMADSSRHAFVWDGAEMIDLGTLGGLSSTAYAINEDGIIAGAARDSQNVMRAVIWVPVPEPSMKALLLAGLGVLACAKRRVSA
jgi:probable HAF family extracellular repeat protein